MRQEASVACVVLAAGGSTRMGAAKQLLDFGGKPLVRHACEGALQSVCHPVVVVVGAQAARVRAALSGLPLAIVENADWSAGMGGSIRAGMAVIPPEADAVLITLADQPYITPAILDGMVGRYQASRCSVVAARYAGTVGVPALFDRALFRALRSLEPEQGCKKILLAQRENAVFFDCPEAEADIDTPQDYARLHPASESVLRGLCP